MYAEVKKKVDPITPVKK